VKQFDNGEHEDVDGVGFLLVDGYRAALVVTHDVVPVRSSLPFEGPVCERVAKPKNDRVL
jgi:hypothetical protein